MVIINGIDHMHVLGKSQGQQDLFGDLWLLLRVKGDASKGSTSATLTYAQRA